MTAPKQTQRQEPAGGFLKTCIGAISDFVRRRPVAWAFAVGGLAITLVAALGLLAATLVLSQSAHAQQASECATGGAVTDPANNPGLVSDCEALLAGRDTLAGTATLNWAADTPIADWDGVTVNGTPLRVTRLWLFDKNLSGEMPAELGSLSNLRTLNLGANDLVGAIPPELGNLSNLIWLFLHRNQLTREVPAELGSLSNLAALYLYSNELTGEIPAELGSLSNLVALYLYSNELTGAIPAELGSLSNLKALELSFNDLNGEIPAELGSLSNLTELSLDSNDLTGEIPAELGSLSNLTELFLSFNQLTGEIPAELGSLSNLTELFLDSNDLTGEIPAELGSLSNLTELLLSGNQLTGEIPAELGSLSNLTWMSLHANRLTGELPASFTGLTGLEVLQFHFNAGLCAPTNEAFQTWLQSLPFVTGDYCVLGDSVPERLALVELYNATNGANWTNNTNWLSDESFSEWHGVTTHASGRVVVGLDLDNNQLTGEIPAKLRNLVNLRDLWLHGNQLSGKIPAELGRLANLRSLLLSGNQLTGEIPADLGILPNLISLELNDNQLTGELPQSFTRLTALETLRFHNNVGLCAPTNEAFQTWLQGVSTVSGDNCGVADSEQDRAALVALYNATDGANWTNNTNWLSDEPIGEWHGVTTDDEGRVAELSLTRNQLSGEIPAGLGSLSNLTELYLSFNQLTGEIPAELGSLSNLQGLWLQRNQLSGEIPAELGSLSNLRSLSLWGNQLSGEIPAELGNLSNLQGLRLQGNQLSGEIPAELGSLSNLQGLSLNSNQLTGDLPGSLTGLALESFVFQNNAGLCAPIDEAFQTWLGSIAFVIGSSCAPVDSPEDRAVLAELYRATGGEGWPTKTNWLSDRPIREWHGVTNDANGRVDRLLLVSNGLTGEVPAELGNLSNLQILRLEGNQLTGEIPVELGSLSNLEWLYLHRNQLTGEIPAELGNLSNLTRLILFGNQLSGEIPAELGNLPNLVWLHLSENQLSGEIPAELGNLPNLTWLYLRDNRLTGCVPPSLRDVPNNDFDQLGLPFCPASPPEAPTIDSVMSAMESLTISWSAPLNDGGSDITAYDLRYIETDEDETADSSWTVVEDVWTTGGGLLQYTLAGLTGGTQYDIQVRAVNDAGDGSWSDTVTGTPIMATTMASACVTEGAVTDATNTGLISDCAALLAARDALAGSGATRSLNWEVGTSISQWYGVVLSDTTPQRVTQLRLHGQSANADRGTAEAKLNGTIPPELGHLSELEILYLHRNNLRGEIPGALNSLSKLRLLYLYDNELTSISDELGSGMSSLRRLFAQRNRIEGAIPAGLGDMPRLDWLRLERNRLTGQIPDRLGNLTTLRRLYLHENRHDGSGRAGLSGGIPATFSGLTNLEYLVVHRNGLSGTIPGDLGSLSNMRWLSLYDNGFNGPIPAELGGLANLERLYLHGNELRGTIPSELGGLASLTNLWLRDNDLSGQIPQSLGELPNLERVRISGNDFTGCIPAGLLDVEDNDLDQLGLENCPSDALEGFSRVTLPTLEPPPAGSIKSGITLADPQELQYLYQRGPKEEITPPFREGGGDRANYWWIFMPPFHFASIANNYELRQGFATGYSVSDDGIEYLLHINPDAVFHNGKSITAAALKDAWEFAAYPDNQVGWGAILLHTRAIQGMKALEAGDATEASGLNVVDDLTLSITMEEFTPTWPLQMAVWMLGIYDTEQARNDPETFRVNPIGAGPYQASYDDATDTQHYDRAANYWGDSPFMDRVVRPTVRDLQTGYLLYENGELDVLYADSVRQPAIWQPDNPFHGDLVLQGGKGLWYTAFVTDHPPFDDLNVRKAFAHAADMWNIVPAILGPKAQYGAGMVTEGNACSQYPDVGYEYNPELAREALAASKYGSAENVPVPTLEISRPSIISIFEVVQEQWKDNLGIEINLVRLEPGQQRREVVEFRRRSLGARIPDPSRILTSLGHSSSGTVQNSGKFSNPRLDALIEAAQSMTLDDPNYCAAWQEIEKTIMDNYYYFPLMAGDDRTWVVQPWVQGYVGSHGQYFNTLPWWQIGVRDRGLYE